MKILHLISSNGLYGAERVVIELGKGLTKKNSCQVTVGLIKNLHNPHMELAAEARANGLATEIFPCAGQFDLATLRSLREFVRRSAIDILHCHGYKSNFYGLLAARKALPTVTTNHNWLKSDWKLKLYCLLDSRWIRYFDRIAAVSREIGEEMCRVGVPREKIGVIENGVDIARFALPVELEETRRGLGLEGDTPVVGTVGCLKPEKGHVYLLQAAREIIKAGVKMKFLLVGDGPLRRELEEYAGEMGVKEHTVFAGNRRDVPELLALMDIFVLPSTIEGLPMALLEALAAKRPVIASKVGGIPRVLRHRENGWLMEARKGSALKEAILSLIQDREGMARMAQAGYETVKNDFSFENMSGKYLELYKGLIS